jgi:hypothetical protein
MRTTRLTMIVLLFAGCSGWRRWHPLLFSYCGCRSSPDDGRRRRTSHGELPACVQLVQPRSKTNLFVLLMFARCSRRRRLHLLIFSYCGCRSSPDDGRRRRTSHGELPACVQLVQPRSKTNLFVLLMCAGMQRMAAVALLLFTCSCCSCRSSRHGVLSGCFQATSRVNVVVMVSR